MIENEPDYATTSSQYKGFRIEVSHVPFDEQLHHSFVERLLAAGSMWGVQDDLWQWTVHDGENRVAGDQELSRAVALEEARYWVDTYAPESAAPDVAGPSGRDL